MGSIATLKGLKCPHCGSEQWQIKGYKGAMGAVALNTVLYLNVGPDQKTEKLQYKCSSCHKKFESSPLVAASEDTIENPCNITFFRGRAFAGALVPIIVFLNGVKVGAVDSGKSITFPTKNRYNVLFVMDTTGVAYKSVYRFEAEPNGIVNARFKQKFL